MKYRSGEIIANKSMGIGNLKRYYSHIYEDNDEIEVIKDSWAI
jgi:hypothetical protein